MQRKLYYYYLVTTESVIFLYTLKTEQSYSQAVFLEVTPNSLGQALGLLVSVRSIHYCTSTPDLSTL